MNLSRRPLRRLRVVRRAKIRRRLTRQWAAAAMVLVLGGLAAATLAHLMRQASWREWLLWTAPSRIEIRGLQPPMSEEILRFLSEQDPLMPAARRARMLKEKFACLAEATPRRLWGKGTLVFDLRLQPVVGRVYDKRSVWGYLGEDGSVFPAPRGVYAVETPRLDLGRADARERRALAETLRELSGPQAPLSALESMKFISAQEGWEARLRNGMVVLWGRLEWTREKADRLGEALKDACGQSSCGDDFSRGGLFTADLRYFGDGKILLRAPALAKALK